MPGTPPPRLDDAVAELLEVGVERVRPEERDERLLEELRSAREDGCGALEQTQGCTHAHPLTWRCSGLSGSAKPLMIEPRLSRSSPGGGASNLKGEQKKVYSCTQSIAQQRLSH
jgi:hypothetical protein